MRLTELEPRWLTFEGRRVGFIFRSPADSTWWQTCFVEPFNTFKNAAGQHYWDNEESAHIDGCQAGIAARSCPEANGRFQLCKVGELWSVASGIASATFETISVTPSIDGSAGGLWHGHITNGEIC